MLWWLCVCIRWCWLSSRWCWLSGIFWTCKRSVWSVAQVNRCNRSVPFSSTGFGHKNYVLVILLWPNRTTGCVVNDHNAICNWIILGNLFDLSLFGLIQSHCGQLLPSIALFVWLLLALDVLATFEISLESLCSFIGCAASVVSEMIIVAWLSFWPVRQTKVR